MTEVFVDTFYYIALLNPGDRFHTAAVQATQTLTSRMATTIWVLTEVADALCVPTLRQHTHRFLEGVMSDSNTLIITDHEPWYARGMQLYGTRPDKSWSLTDCISFEIMTERGITDALTGDRHFVQAGFQALLLPS